MAKLNKQQVSIVAQKVKEQVEKNQKVSTKQLEAIDKYLAEKAEIEKQEKELQKKKDVHIKAFEKANKISISYYTRTKEQLVNAFKKRVNLSDIENEIVLNSIFDKSEDLEGFIAKLVKKFS